LFERYPRDPHVRGALFSTLKTYRKIRKSKMKEYHRKIIDLLDYLLGNNPKKYWSTRISRIPFKKFTFLIKVLFQRRK
jgi:hypothetical protein